MELLCSVLRSGSDMVYCGLKETKRKGEGSSKRRREERTGRVFRLLLARGSWAGEGEKWEGSILRMILEGDEGERKGWKRREKGESDLLASTTNDQDERSKYFIPIQSTVNSRSTFP